MRAQAQSMVFLLFHRDPVADEVPSEYVPFEQEIVVLLERFIRAAKRIGHAGDIRQLFGRELVEVLVERIARVDPFWIPSRPASRSAEQARYVLAAGSGVRNSTRLVFGLGEYGGIRMAADRLRAE